MPFPSGADCKDVDMMINLTVPGVIFFWAQEDVESLTTASKG